MSKMFGTKKKIIKLLESQAMNLTEISSALGLSKATVSQHISELEDMSLIEQINNDHYKKVKYYKLSGKRNPIVNPPSVNRSMSKVLIPSLIGVLVVAAILGFFVYSQKPTSTQSPSLINTTPHIGSQGFACPMIRAFPNGTHPNATTLGSILSELASGGPCSLLYVNTSMHEVANLNYTSENGTISVPSLNYKYSINSTAVKMLESAGDSGYCTDFKVLEFFGINYTKPSGVVCTASNQITA